MANGINGCGLPPASGQIMIEHPLPESCDLACVTRLEILIKGLVQGVGFRPHVYQIARQLGLTGWVKNNAAGVLIEVQGENTRTFIPTLTASLPPLARIDTIQTKQTPLVPDENCFQITASEPGLSRTMITADTSICNACLHELFDPQSRYYHYPFLNCTHCGPRFTITRQLPYDRSQTSMNPFPLCAECFKDYTDPDNRRYHAQPTACASCGPALSASINDIAQALLDGKIIALKGLGGYQLLCNARNQQAINTLRQRKNRAAKPFALMVLNTQSAQSIADINPEEQRLLTSPARPIVLLKQNDQSLPDTIAPGLSHLGIMLPSTPVHYLLFHALLRQPDGHQWLDQTSTMVLIVTSANHGGNPLVIDDDAARLELETVADQVVAYHREIVTRADDSVVQLINHAPSFIRRARGYAPAGIKLPYAVPATLALGAHLKNTFCITRNDEAFVSQHMGSLTNKQTIEFFHESLHHWIRFTGVTPECIACDQHPDFYTSMLANEFNLDVIPVQHHHAHLAAVAAEHHLVEPALGLALDGYGYGTGGESWGGELMLFDCKQFHRLGSLLPLPQPGGDMAAREPWRMAAGVLHACGMNRKIIELFPDEPQALLVAQLLQSPIPLSLTSSCGRLFDAASALLGINRISSYEGQAARQMESLVTKPDIMPGGWYIEQKHLSFLPLLTRLLQLDPVTGANLFHGTLIAGLTDWIVAMTAATRVQAIVLAGGCFLNQVLAEGLSLSLARHGMRAFLPRLMPPNDGGLSLGQAFVAGTKKLHVIPTCEF